MGYEKFVKKVFPFIGNQYRGAEESSGDEYNKIDLIVGEVIVDDAVCYIDFNQGKPIIIPNGEFEKALNHLIMFSKDGKESIESIGLTYLTLDGQTTYFWYSAQDQLEGNNLPWDCEVLDSGMRRVRTDVITADMLGVKDAFVKFNPDFDVNNPESWTEDLLIATIYYKK